MAMIRKKVAVALKKAEAKTKQNKFYVFWKGKEETEIVDKSLVIILTEYD